MQAYDGIAPMINPIHAPANISSFWLADDVTIDEFNASIRAHTITFIKLHPFIVTINAVNTEVFMSFDEYLVNRQQPAFMVVQAN